MAKKSVEDTLNEIGDKVGWNDQTKMELLAQYCDGLVGFSTVQFSNYLWQIAAEEIAEEREWDENE
jgi:hypothetical protein